MEDGRAVNPWFREHLQSLESVREELWTVLEKLGTVKPKGSFYFLIPLPPKVSECRYSLMKSRLIRDCSLSRSRRKKHWICWPENMASY